MTADPKTTAILSRAQSEDLAAGVVAVVRVVRKWSA